MRRLIATALCAFLLGSALGLGAAVAYPAAPAVEPRLAVPIAQYQAAPTATPGPASLTLLDGGDNTFVSSAPSPFGCTFLAYIDRDTSNQLLIKQDGGDRLIDVKPPLVPTFAGPRPDFNAPGDKEAAGDLLIIQTAQGWRLILYYTGRAVGDPSGSFHLWRLDMPLPACQTSAVSP